MPASWIATLLDQEQIERSGAIAPRPQRVEDLPDRSGSEVAEELGNRLLARYLAPDQVTAFNHGSSRAHWVTPTPITPEDLVSWLALFAPTVIRRHALLLDPSEIDVVRGPAWIRAGQGIEYYLPNGFTERAVFDVGVIQVR